MTVATSTSLPKDVDSVPIQVLSPVEGTVVNFLMSSSTNPQALPAGAQIVEVAVSGNALVAFGSAPNAATSGHLLVTGVYIYRVPSPSGITATKMDAVTVDGSSGRCTIVKLI